MSKLHQPIELSKASSHFRGKVARVFSHARVKEFFGTAPLVTSEWEIKSIQAWLLIEGLRRRVEAHQERKLAALLKKTGEDVAEFYTRTFDEAATTAHIERTLKPQLDQYLTVLYRETAREVGPHADSVVFLKKKTRKNLTILDPAELPEYKIWLNNVAAQQIANISIGTVLRVKEIIDRSIRDGLTIDETRTELRNSSGFSKVRAERIARTEVVSASNASLYYTVFRYYSPDETTKNWVATNDRRTRPTHSKAGATQRDVPFSDYFVVGGVSCMFPGDSLLPARERVNCRCTMTFDMAMP